MIKISKYRSHLFAIVKKNVVIVLMAAPNKLCSLKPLRSPGRRQLATGTASGATKKSLKP